MNCVGFDRNGKTWSRHLIIIETKTSEEKKQKRRKTMTVYESCLK